jgi:hypothetical protein
MVRHGTATWPGAISIDSCTYTLSHGISPGTAILKMLPQDSFPAEVGTLTIGDGIESVSLPDCKVDSMIVEHDGNGFIWSLAILDRRWKWKDLGAISGAYNQLDPHSKLIPWTIRSPRELALLCLQAMGETRFEIDLPPGLDRAIGVMHGQLNPPHIGVRPVTGTNPPVNWEAIPPAQALAQLCEMFGRRAIYRASTDSILIAIPGQGASLPDGSVARESPSINSPETPSGVQVFGAPTRYQTLLNFDEAVGEEWDGSYVPINLLSYAPRYDGKVQISEAQATCGGNTNTFQAWIAGDGEDPITEGVLFESTTNAASTAANDIAIAINLSVDPRVAGVVTAADDGNGKLTVTGVQVGVSFAFLARMSGTVSGTADFVDALVQAAEPAGAGWSQSAPPMFAGVRATDRLTLEEARALAQKSVFRCYRLTLKAPSGRGPLIVPGAGQMVRRQQIVLLDSQVEQVVPEDLDPNLVNPRLAELDRAALQPAIINFYNGYSRDKPAVMYGRHAVQVALDNGFRFWRGNFGLENTQRDAQVFIPFQIDPIEQIVTFSTYVFQTTGDVRGGVRYYPLGSPVLKTSVHVRDANTNALNRFNLWRLLPGMSGLTNFAVRVHDDVQMEVVGKYNANWTVAGAVALDVDAQLRAKYYLDGLAAQYLVEGGLAREYNGIRAVDCDGAIAQVTWEVGGGGARTVASRNSEHSIYVPPYPARRRAEFLAPANQAAIAAAVRPPNLGRELFG